MKQKISIFKNQFHSLSLIEKTLSTFPLFAIMGSLAVNIFYFITVTIALLHIYKDKVKVTVNNKLVFSLLIFYLIVIISYLLSDYKNTDSLIRTLFVIKFFILPIIFINFVKNNFFFNILGAISGFVIIFLSLDLIFQFTFGYDFFGYKPISDNRLSGFLDEELIAGSFISFFVIFFFISLNLDLNKKKDFISFFVAIIFFLFIIIITGERLALIRFLFLFFLVLILIEKNFWRKTISGLSIILIIFLFFNFNEPFKSRISQALFMSGFNISLTKYDVALKKYEGKNKISNSPWVGHWKVAHKIFKDNKLTGVGLKNFRIACQEEKYTLDNLLNDNSCTTHPHNFYMEILSELGILGLLIFLIIIFIFINFLLKALQKTLDINMVLISSLLLFSIIPFFPSGSIFSSYNGGILFYFISSYFVILKFNASNR